ncbi:MAG: hypothetical protein AB1589_18415 [Cyanobacteriota bacterium]
MTEQQQKREDNSFNRSETGRRAELSPDDFPQGDEQGFDARQSNASNEPNPEWNPDDFETGQHQQ